ncbi:MAG: hypothetical protein AB8B61_00025 [Cyclobacteriaceae bacterium]
MSFNNQLKNLSKIEVISILGSFGVIIFYLFVIIKHSVNAPIWDEYYTVLEYFNNYLSSESNLEKIKIFFTNQHNGHRLYLNNILLTVYYYLFGTINFKVLTIIGNLFLVALLFIFKKSFIPKKSNYLLFPISCLLINFQYYLSSIMEIASIEFFGAFFLIYLSLYLLKNGGLKQYILALLLGLLGFYTCAHGILLGPIGALLLLLYKRWRLCFIWIIVFAIMTVLYLNDLKQGWGPKPVSVSENLFCNTEALFSFFMKLIGSPFYIFGNVEKLVFAAGLTISSLIMYLVYQLFNHKKYLLLCGLLLIVSSLFLVSLGRLQLSSPSESRFRLYSSILYVLLVISFVTYREKKTPVIVKLALQATCVAYFSFTFNIQKDYLNHLSHYIKINKSCYVDNPEESYGYRCPSQKEAIELVNQAHFMGYYSHHPMDQCPIKEGSNKLTDFDWSKVKYVTNNEVRFTFQYEWLSTNIRVKGNGFHLKQQNSKNHYFVVLTSELKKIIYPCKKIMNRNLRSIQQIGYDYNGYEKIIDTRALAPGSYQVGLILLTEANEYYFKTINQVIEI